jgi:hypothetical protein
MALTPTDKDVIASELGEEVEQFLEDFTQDWQAAGEYALMNADDPQDDDSNTYWWISFAGNMLWAAAAFFPGGGAVQTLEKGVATWVDKASNVKKFYPIVSERASNWPVATRAASVLGALGASNVVGMAGAMSNGRWSLQQAKHQMTKLLASKRGAIKETFIKGAKAWIGSSLLPRALTVAGIQDGDGSTRDSATIKIFGADQRDERRMFTWGNYIFPATPSYSSNSKERISTLGDYMTKQIDDALKSFDKQWKDYQRAHVYEGKARRPAFQAAISFDLPSQISQPGPKPYKAGDGLFR